MGGAPLRCSDTMGCGDPMGCSDLMGCGDPTGGDPISCGDRRGCGVRGHPIGCSHPMYCVDGTGGHLGCDDPMGGGGSMAPPRFPEAQARGGLITAWVGGDVAWLVLGRFVLIPALAHWRPASAARPRPRTHRSVHTSATGIDGHSLGARQFPPLMAGAS